MGVEKEKKTYVKKIKLERRSDFDVFYFNVGFFFIRLKKLRVGFYTYKSRYLLASGISWPLLNLRNHRQIEGPST